MTLDQIRQGIIISAIATVLSGLGFVYFLVAAKNVPEPEPALPEETGTGASMHNTDVLGESTENNFFQYKSIFERSLNNLSDKKTVEFYESKITEAKIRYYYKNDYRSKRFSRMADYNIEDFSNLEELKKKLDVVNEVYVDGVFYVADTEGLSTFNESEDKKFENSTIHLEDIKTNFSKYLELYEAEEGVVSVLDLPKDAPEDITKTRYGFQSQILGDAALIVDENFDIWEMSVDYKGTYTTFTFEAYDSDLNIVPLEEGIDLNLTPSPEVSPTPEVSPEVTPVATLAEPSQEVSPTTMPVQENEQPTAKNTNTAADFRLSGNCSKIKGTCYLEYSLAGSTKKVSVSNCDSDCDARKTFISLQNEQYQYVVEGWKESTGYTRLYRFDKNTNEFKTVATINQNIITKFDVTRAGSSIQPKLANYTDGCFEAATAGLYCVGNLNQMSEADVQKIEDYINEATKFHKTYIQPFI